MPVTVVSELVDLDVFLPGTSNLVYTPPLPATPPIDITPADVESGGAFVVRGITDSDVVSQIKLKLRMTDPQFGPSEDEETPGIFMKTPGIIYAALTGFGPSGQVVPTSISTGASYPSGITVAVTPIVEEGSTFYFITGDTVDAPAGTYEIEVTFFFDPAPGIMLYVPTAAYDYEDGTPVTVTVLSWEILGPDEEEETFSGTTSTSATITVAPEELTNNPAPGTIEMSIPNLEWEPARCAHSWLLPQRTNMVANPSFEVDVNGLLNGVTYSKLYELSGDAEGDADVTIGLTEGTFGTGTFGSGTFGLPGAPSDPDVKVWVLVFDAAGAYPKTYDILPNPWFTLRSDGWLVAITTVEPTSVEISSVAAGIDKTGSLAGTQPMGTFNAVLYGISGVDLTSEESLVIVAGAEFNTGIVAAGFDTNQLGGTTVVSNPLVPEAGEHVNGRFVMQIAGRWVPSSPTNYLVQFGTEPMSFTGLPNPTTPGNEHKITEILTMEFLSTVPLAAFGWRTNGDIDIVNSGTVGVPGPRPLGSGVRPKSGHITGGDPYEYLPAVGSIEAVTMNRIILESNLFPTAVSQDRFMSLEAQVAGTGLARIGLVTWDPAKLVPSYTHGPWVSVTGSTVFHPIRHLVQLPDRAEEACFRLEFLGEEVWVDNVLVDNNAAQLGFFDGDWHTGMQGDFSWYGAWGDTGAVDPSAPDPLANLRNRSYSLYYNDRRNQDAYLFGYTEEVAKDGNVYDLAPYGAVGTPTTTIDENATVQEARDKLLATGIAGATLGVTHLITDPGTPGGLIPELVGQLDLADLTVLRRVGGAAWGYVPEGADVIPQWDEVYGIRLPCWPGDLFIPVKDVSSMPVTEIEEI